MIRFLKYRSLLLRRMNPRSKQTLMSRLLHSELVAWNQGTASRGVAIGMFWAFIPIPFQMLPASMFCWMVRGNLPIALLCVWITNPITLAPILLFEYRLGELFLEMMLKTQASGFMEGSSGYALFAGGLRNILVGGLVLSCVMMIVSYLFIIITFNVSRVAHAQRREHHRIKSKSKKGKAHAKRQAIPQRNKAG